MSTSENGSIPKPSEHSKIILDANALVAPFQLGFNIDLELDRILPGVPPVVPSSVIKELMAPSKSRDWNVRAALKLAQKYEKIDIKGRGDAPIFNLAINKGWIVMTQDKRLRNKLLSGGIRIIVIRGKGHLQLIEP